MARLREICSLQAVPRGGLRHAAELAAETAGLEPTTQLLVSEIVRFDNEVRCWLLDGHVVTLATYEGTADLDATRAFAAGAAGHAALPTCVLDIGLVRDGDWPSSRRTRPGVPA
jgi:hypothetical protein